MYQELGAEQSRVQIDMSQLYAAVVEVYREAKHYRGGMHWKNINGTEYLYRTLDRRGNAKSLGPRAQRTEATYQEFHVRKQQLELRIKGLEERLYEQARFCVAARVNRVPRLVTALLRRLEEQPPVASALMVVGTNALYAYEAMAGCRVDSGLLATTDIDLLWDARRTLKLLVMDETLKEQGLIGLLRQVDKSFEPQKGVPYRAINAKGYMVDLIKPASGLLDTRTKITGNDELLAAEIPAIKWLLASPKVSQTVIGDDGLPATMTCPDPRAFAAYKAWLSQQIGREPGKKRRDLLQAQTVLQLVRDRLPQFHLSHKELQQFPEAIRGAVVESDGPEPPSLFRR